MIAESLSASLISRFSVPAKQPTSLSYYRSKLFVVTSGSNSIVSAAAPLLSLLERLGISPTLPPIDTIYKNVEHELNAFYSRLNGQECNEELVLIAHYLLSATIDELLGKNYLRTTGQVAEFKAFTPSSHQLEGPEIRFFDIVNFIKDKTHQYLDLIELAYYCLIAGFEGQYHRQAGGRQALDNLIEELFQIIQKNRVHKSPSLFKIPSLSLQPTKNYKSLFTSAALACGLVITIYLLSHVSLEYKAKTVLLEHTAFAHLDN